MDKTEKRRFLFVSVFSLIAIMIVCGFAVAATNDGKIELNKTATKVYDGVDSSNQAYGKLAQVNLDVTAKSYIEGTVSKQLDVVLVVDGSGSMAYGPDGEWDYTGTPRIDSLIDTTYDFINEIMDTEGNVKLGLVEYGDSVKNTYDMTTDKKTALTYVDELTANGGTNLQSGIEKAHQLLDQGGRANVPKVVIILTDGVPTFFNHNGEFKGSRVRVKVIKNKVAPPFREAEFDVVYGEGISKVGNILDMAVNLDIVEKAGSWFSYNGERIGQGRENVKNYLKANPEMLDEIESKVRENFAKAFEQSLGEEHTNKKDDEDEE